MSTLTTERLLLRQFRNDDFDAYAEMCGDPEVMRYIGPGQPQSRLEAWRSLAAMVGHWHLRGYGMWAVEERASGAMIGRVGCFFPEGWPGFEVGWALRRAWWGRGFATEAARVALSHAFLLLDQPHVVSLIHPNNAASIRVAQRLGERLEGRTELLGNEALVYGLHRDDWAKGREPSA
jgi:RimJ/RimL family protein N-acetyltransferase